MTGSIRQLWGYRHELIRWQCQTPSHRIERAVPAVERRQQFWASLPLFGTGVAALAHTPEGFGGRLVVLSGGASLERQGSWRGAMPASHCLNSQKA